MTPTDIFIEKAKHVHGDTYGYQHVHYINARSKVIVHCFEHGPFQQTANNHLNGQGCPQCATAAKIRRIQNTSLGLSEFIRRASAHHLNKYDYSSTVYVSSNKPVVVRCVDHGEFIIKRAEKHLMGQGCPVCSRRGSLAEEIIKKWLSNAGVLFYYQHTFEGCYSPTTNRKLVFDFYIPTHNLIIEYDGEQHVKKSPLFHPGDKFNRMIEHDKIKNNYAHNHGVKVLRIPHTRFVDIPQILTEAFN